MARTRLEGARVGAILSVAAHLALVAICLIAIRLGHDANPTQASNDPPRQSIIWRVVAGPIGGGGGGGEKAPRPARRAELDGRDKITVPAKPAEVPAETPAEEPPPSLLNIDAVPMAAANQALAGTILNQSATDSRGPGDGGGANDGAGRGDGPGRGPGLGPGSSGNTGGDVYREGSGVTMPILIRDVKPQYTPDAMRAHVQGSVWLECIVLADGSVGDVKITRSLDPRFGLDEEAIRVAKQWRFRPGSRLGQPVAVIVTIELSFNLR